MVEEEIFKKLMEKMSFVKILNNRYNECELKGHQKINLQTENCDYCFRNYLPLDLYLEEDWVKEAYYSLGLFKLREELKE